MENLQQTAFANKIASTDAKIKEEKTVTKQLERDQMIEAWQRIIDLKDQIADEFLQEFDMIPAQRSD